jgi:hypothetical protein
VEQIIPGALTDLLKIGTGWVLAVILAWGYWLQSRFISDMLVKLTEVSTRANEVSRDLLTVQRERVLTEKDMTSAMQVMATKVDSSTSAAKERADDIKRLIVNERDP